MEPVPVPKVSWLIAVKNGMPYLPQALASIAAQTYRDFEVLVCVDDSTDGTLEELRRWIPGRLPGGIVVGKSQGIAAALASLVELSRAEFCARLDADDIAFPERMALQMEYLQNHPDISLVAGQMKQIDGDGCPLEETVDYPLEHEQIISRLLWENPIVHPAVLFRRQDVLAVGNYRPGKIEDYDLWLRLASRYRLANMPGPMVYRRVHELSGTRIAIRTNQLQSQFDEVFVEQTPGLFGWDAGTARKFRAKEIKCMFLVAVKLASYRARKEECSAWRVLRRPGLIDAFQNQMNERDVLSGLGFALIDPRKGSVRRAVREFYSGPGLVSRTIRGALRRGIEKLPFGNRLLANRWARQEKKKYADWLTGQRMKGTCIHDGLDFKGRKPGYPWVTFEGRILIEKDVTIWISDDEGSDPDLQVGAESFIGFRTFLGIYQPMKIGRRVLIGANCYLISSDHRYARRDIPIRDQGFTGAPVIIEDDAWLGTHVTVLPGVTIGRGAIVGAGSVVNRNIPAWEVWGGVPARFLKHRPE